MIKIKPLSGKKYEPRYVLRFHIGFGEHCDDRFECSDVTIDNKKLTESRAEEIYKFFANIFDVKKNEGGEPVDHLVLNDGPDTFWHCKCGGMTEEEFKWFKDFYDEFELDLYCITSDWYGLIEVTINYLDENGNWHNCEIV